MKISSTDTLIKLDVAPLFGILNQFASSNTDLELEIKKLTEKCEVVASLTSLPNEFKKLKEQNLEMMVVQQTQIAAQIATQLSAQEESFGRKIDELQASFSTFSAEMTNLPEKIKEMEEDMTKLKNTEERLTADVQTARKTATEAKIKAGEASELGQEVNKRCAMLDQMIAEMGSSLKKLEKKTDQVKSDLQKTENACVSLQSWQNQQQGVMEDSMARIRRMDDDKASKGDVEALASTVDCTLTSLRKLLQVVRESDLPDLEKFCTDKTTECLVALEHLSKTVDSNYSLLIKEIENRAPTSAGTRKCLLCTAVRQEKKDEGICGEDNRMYADRHVRPRATIASDETDCYNSTNALGYSNAQGFKAKQMGRKSLPRVNSRPRSAVPLGEQPANAEKRGPDERRSFLGTNSRPNPGPKNMVLQAPYMLENLGWSKLDFNAEGELVYDIEGENEGEKLHNNSNTITCE